MATNKSMIEILELIHQYIETLDTQEVRALPEAIADLKACNKILKKHITAQKKQKGADYGDSYVQNKETGEYERVYN